MTYVPFDSSDEEIAEREVLRPGVPSSMRPAIVTWIFKTCAEGSYMRPAQFHEIANALDIDSLINPTYTGLITESDARKLLAPRSERELLHIVDYVLHERPFGSEHLGLTKILEDGRSKYHVAERDRSRRLATKVPEGVQTAAEAIIATGTAAGRLLNRAWTNVYDLEPNDSAGYAAAVKAVETAAFSALGITDPRATLGDAIRAIAEADARWRLPFLREHTEYPSKDLLLGTLKSLYRGQRDRHGSEAYSDVTHDEAEGAVLLAVTLVGWFSRGLVVEREVADFS